MTPRRRWGTPRDDSAVGNDDIDWLVRSLVLLVHDLRGLPLRRLPSTEPCSMIFGSWYATALSKAATERRWDCCHKAGSLKVTGLKSVTPIQFLQIMGQAWPLMWNTGRWYKLVSLSNVLDEHRFGKWWNNFVRQSLLCTPRWNIINLYYCCLQLIVTTKCEFTETLQL